MYLFVYCLLNRLQVYLFMNELIDWLIYLFIHSFIPSFIVYVFICLFSLPFVYLFG